MREQQSMLRMTDAFQQSTGVMTAMNEAFKIPEMQKNMMDMAREMEKAGLISEIMTETIDDVLEVDQDAVDAEVENVLYDITSGILGTAPTVATKAMPAAASTVKQPEVEIDED